MDGRVPVRARDGVIALNVSGKSFSLLRSTASLSPTLQRHLTAADDNTALLKDGAVFRWRAARSVYD